MSETLHQQTKLNCTVHNECECACPLKLTCEMEKIYGPSMKIEPGAACRRACGGEMGGQPKYHKVTAIIIQN